MKRMEPSFLSAAADGVTSTESSSSLEKKRRNRCISLLLQSVERVIICEKLSAILRDEGREITGYIHVGLLFDRREGEEFPTELIERASARLRESTGFDLKLAQEELVLPRVDLWRTDASLPRPSAPVPPSSTAVKDVPVGYPQDVLNQIAISSELGGDSGQEVQTFIDRNTS